MEGDPPRAHHVGSLLRPPELLRAREAREEGHLDAASFRAIEDRAVNEVVAMQREVGLPVVTDGELRRTSFQSQLAEAVDGLATAGLDTWVWGDWRGDERVGDATVERPEDIGVRNRLRRRRFPTVEEFVYLRARTEPVGDEGHARHRPAPKVTLPSPGLFANLWSPDAAPRAYPTLDAFLADVVDLLRDEAAELARLGATRIQLDAPHYPLLLDPATRTFYEERGGSVERWLQRGLEMDDAVIDAAPGVSFGFHLCRGNQGSRWLVEGAWDPLVGPLLSRVRADELHLEYDDARAGSFDALRELPDDRLVVLGLVTTKRPELEPTDRLVDAIHEAARHHPMDRLAVGTQCGFSTSVLGNALGPDDQRAKLDRVVEVARRVWGRV